MPKRWAPKTALRNRAQLVGLVAGSDLHRRLAAAEGDADRPARAQPGPARGRDPRRRRDRRGGQDRPRLGGRHRRHLPGRPRPRHQAEVDRRRAGRARSSTSARPSCKGGRGVQQAEADPKEVVPVTFALTPQAAARGHRGGVVRRRGPARAAAARRPRAAARRASGPTRGPTRDDPAPRCCSRSPTPSSPRARRRSPRRARGCRSSTASPTPRSSRARCAGSRSTSSILHDALGAVPVLEVARDIASSFPEVGLVLIAADDSPDMLRAAMQAGLRDVVSLPLSLEQLEGSVRAASQWSRTMRDRVAGEESAGAALGGQLIAVAGAKGGVGTTTVCLQLALAAVRAAPGRPVCLVDFDLQKGDFRSFLDMPYRRSVVDLVEVADEISVRHLQETLYTHKEGFRVLLAPDDGERAEEVNALAARPILSRRQGAPRADDRRPRRHRLGGERDRRRDRQPRARRHPARRRLAARRQAAARPVEAPAGARGRRGRARRAQPRVAQARGPARPRAQGGRAASSPRRRSPPTSPPSRPP